MQRRLLDLLICPRCLPAEKPLRASLRDLREGDVHTATLTCPSCAAVYPVRDGVAVLLAAPPPVDQYATSQRLAAYLWSHYADLENDPDAHHAFAAWRELLAECDGPLLDAGCAVGRLSFEATRHADPVIGVDLSLSFVQAARTLAREGRLPYAPVIEGELTESRLVRLPGGFSRERAEFLVADVQAIPFAAGTFGTVTSLNLLDRVAVPRRHLAELNRVTRAAAAALLVADPWSWGESPALVAAWLGGGTSGRSAGSSLANLTRLLSDELAPPWRVAASGRIDWTLRHHRNHFELIRSDYLLARR